MHHGEAGLKVEGRWLMFAGSPTSCHLPPVCSIAPVRPTSEFGCSWSRENGVLSAFWSKNTLLFSSSFVNTSHSQGRGGDALAHGEVPAAFSPAGSQSPEAVSAARPMLFKGFGVRSLRLLISPVNPCPASKIQLIELEIEFSCRSGKRIIFLNTSCKKCTPPQAWP